MVDMLNQMAREYVYHEANELRGYVSEDKLAPIILNIAFLREIECMMHKNLIDTENLIKGKLNLKDVKHSDEIIKKFIAKNEVIRGVISDVFLEFINEQPEKLKDIVHISNGYVFENVENYGEFFNEILYYINNRYVDITPKSINRLISEILKNEPAKTIYDGAMGSGALINEVQKYHKETNVYGQDISKNIVNFYKMKLILESKIEELDNIKIGNTITQPAFLDGDRIKKFDLVVSNPPIMVKGYGLEIIQQDKYNRFYRGLPSKQSADFAFLTHFVESIDENGVGVLLVPGGVLFRSGKEGAIRESIINENLIDSVILLPGNMLYNTAIQMNLLIIRKNKKDKDILFIDASKCFKREGRLSVLSDEYISKIVDIYNKRECVKNFSNLVQVSDVVENDYNLSVQRYVKLEERKEIDLKQVTKEISIIEKSLFDVHRKLDEILG
ncbi:N-6 DNA methylase [Intestinibacter bartlettii]|uniref:site-specific DNA-methyltransferase (adenine-specific) n=1 Tax=Intestinibacter bartlettii TaxID=261299 RepID=A0ABS6DXK9_9FIRM|nr:N-6 DNA methylase [Intestinibacter bartlettii]MBU5336576.1 SAM-dependent methyltransferase [Intestinibacter bartlettii]